VLTSHDGYGLGHTRRNLNLARALLADPAAHVVVVTGLDVDLAGMRHPRLRVVKVPPLVKDASGAYVHPTMSFEDATAARGRIVQQLVSRWQPHAMVVDRHPYGIGGELRPAIEHARSIGTRTVLGLRDILDEPEVVRRELGGRGWDAVTDLFDAITVYGGPSVCDHELEYGLPMTPHYTGWVVDQVEAAHRYDDLVVATCGGGGDGARLQQLVLDTAAILDTRRFLVVAGPHAERTSARSHTPPAEQRPSRPRGVVLVRSIRGCAQLYVHAGAVVQMAGYNSTYEALAGGIRPILLPRRSPRREQAIRASRLAALGLADVLDDATTPSELAWLLGQDRSSDADRAARAGVRLDGAERAAELVRRLVDDDLPMPPVEAQRPIVDDVHAGDAGRVGRVPDRIARALVG
jgi:predicted glycosyltransferase